MARCGYGKIATGIPVEAWEFGFGILSENTPLASCKVHFDKGDTANISWPAQDLPDNQGRLWSRLGNKSRNGYGISYSREAFCQCAKIMNETGIIKSRFFRRSRWLV